MQTETASSKVHDFVNEHTQTGSAEATIQNLVRRAYALTVNSRNDGWCDEHTANTWRDAAEFATQCRILNEDISQAVDHDHGF